VTQNMEKQDVFDEAYGPNVKMTCGPTGGVLEAECRPSCQELRPAKTGRHGSVPS